MTGNNNTNDNRDNTTFTIKDTDLYVSVITLSGKDDQKLSKILSKGFQRSVYWSDYKRKCENENTTNEYRYFLESNLYKLADCLYRFTQIKMTILKGIKPKVLFTKRFH